MKLNIGQKLNLGFSSILILFILVGGVIYLFNLQITDSATTIREDDVPGAILALSLLDKISDMNGNLHDYLLGEVESKEEFASNYQEFLGSFEALEQLETTPTEIEVMKEVEQLLSTYVTAANAEVFNKFDPEVERWAVGQADEIEHEFGEEFEELLEEAKESQLQDAPEIRAGEESLTANQARIRYIELLERAGDLVTNMV
ncbi:MAG: MCP four helix bundle domain-containing protein, partial [Nitrospira sp.]|nr:MCP four helix bundle domain-containing protein [Nitrospira sp.]